MAEVKYDSATIVSYEHLDHIRVSPKAYIKSSDSEGIIHTAWEYIANSIDEVGMRPEGGIITLGLFRDSISGRFQLVVKDNGRGIPSDKMVKALTSIGTSGKIAANSAYRASGGQLGMGAKAAAALSSKYRTLSVNYLEDVVGSVSLADGKIIGTEVVPMKANPGVTAVFELDVPQFFADGTDFTRTGYLDLVNLCRQLNVFNTHIVFKFYIYERLLPDEYWTTDAASALGLIDNLLYNSPHETVYDSDAVIDKSDYLFTIWKVNSSILYTEAFHKSPRNDKDKLAFDIKFYLTKKGATAGAQYFIAVNNVYLIEKANNDVSLTFLNTLRTEISKYQPTPEYKNFVLQNYNFPTLLLAIDVKYNGAKFSGVTKTNFKDHEFATQFAKELKNLVIATHGDDYWFKLSEILKDDINTQYSRYYDVPLRKSEGRRVFMDLHFHQNYHECKSSDNTKCELYIVEGTSAGNIAKTRDSNFQAIYEARGKPFNAATAPGSLADKRKRLMSYEVYQDLSRILNIGAGTTDMNTARFSKIVIATDADPDGYHIAALHLNNLYILNPLIVTSGMVYIARPPLFSMEVDRGKYTFLRDKNALADARIEFIYNKVFSISTQTSNGVEELSGVLLRDTIDVIKQVGAVYASIADAIHVPLRILERLVIGLDKIYPHVKYDELASLFASSDGDDSVRVRADAIQQILTVSMDKDDYHIPLARIGAMITQYILPLAKKYATTKTQFIVRTRAPGSAYYDKPIVASVAWLYEAMHELDTHLPIKIRRYKGLGEMPTDSCSQTLMNPDTRVITQITDMGDLITCGNLLGSDSTWRKQLLAGSTTLSAAFLRTNDLMSAYVDCLD